VGIPSLEGDRMFPTAVNSNGLVTGLSSTSKGRYHAFAWTKAGGTVDLGTLKGGSESFAQIVTEDGTIIGTADAPGKRQRAFTWTASTGMVELPSLGGPFDAVLAANASGVLVGVSSLKDIKGRTDERAAIWTPVASTSSALDK